MNALTPFDFEGRAVRVVEDASGVPWFVARDVCECLGIRNSSDAVSRLDDDERSDVGVSDTSSNGVVQERSVLAVAEPGVYKLCFRSNKPEAKRLVRWITHDVLPALRRTGRYEVPESTPEPPPVPLASNHRADVLVSAARGFNALIRTARTVGLSRARSVRAANDATLRATGIDLIDELDANDIIDPSADLAERAAASSAPAAASVGMFVEAWRNGDFAAAFAPVLITDLYKLYLRWAANAGIHPLHIPRFSAELTRCGLTSSRKRWINERGAVAGPSTVVMPPDAVRPTGETEQEWLGRCVTAFRASIVSVRACA